MAGTVQGQWWQWLEGLRRVVPRAPSLAARGTTRRRR